MDKESRQCDDAEVVEQESNAGVITLFKRVQVFFMSGTGNSFRVASWIHEIAVDHGCNSNLAPIEGDLQAEQIVSGARNLLALVFPTHGFTAPWPMLKFTLRLPRCRGTEAIVLPTRAGTKFGNLFFPGFEGTAGYLVALILALKGYRVRGVMAVDMPSNWTAVHPGFSVSSAQAIIQRAQPRVESFLQYILAGKNKFYGMLSLVFGLAFLPVSMGYLLMGRFFLSKLFFATTACDGCGVCARGCPANAIQMKGKANPRPFWTFDCESCMRCMNYCPKHAIEASHLLVVVFLMLTNVSASVLLLNWLAAQAPWMSSLNNGFIQGVIQYVYILASIAFTYWLFSMLIRLPWVNKFFSHATLTRYYRRYHEPETKLGEMKK